MIDAFMVGCIFIKISKPKDRNDSLIFSENAVIAIRDGKYCFMFRYPNGPRRTVHPKGPLLTGSITDTWMWRGRSQLRVQKILGSINCDLRIGNLRNSLFVKCVCKVKFIKSKQTVEGEFLPLDQKENGNQIVRYLSPIPVIMTHGIHDPRNPWQWLQGNLRPPNERHGRWFCNRGR